MYTQVHRSAHVVRVTPPNREDSELVKGLRGRGCLPSTVVGQSPPAPVRPRAPQCQHRQTPAPTLALPEQHSASLAAAPQHNHPGKRADHRHSHTAPGGTVRPGPHLTATLIPAAVVGTAWGSQRPPGKYVPGSQVPRLTPGSELARRQGGDGGHSRVQSLRNPLVQGSGWEAFSTVGWGWGGGVAWRARLPDFSAASDPGPRLDGTAGGHQG